MVAAETELSKNIYERGVDSKGFANIRSKGDWALFGGLNTGAMKRNLGIAENRPLADFYQRLPFLPSNWLLKSPTLMLRKMIYPVKIRLPKSM